MMDRKSQEPERPEAKVIPFFPPPTTAKMLVEFVRRCDQDGVARAAAKSEKAPT